MSAKAKLGNLGTIDQRSLFVGLGIVGAIYFFVYIYVVAFNGSTVKDIESTLASQIILIESKPAEPVPAKESNAAEATPTPKPKIPLLIEGLYQKSTFGNIPIIRSSDGMTSFKAYKKPFTFPQGSKPLLAVIITDFGLSKSTSETALDLLPPEVSFSLSPYADMAAEWAKILRQSGHEFWAHIPLEQTGNESSDPGTSTIFINAGFVKNQKTLQKTLAQVQSYPGISSTSSTLSNDNQITKIIEEALGRGLGYLELNPTADPTFANLAISHNAPYIKADMEIVFKADGNNPFQSLEKILNTKGYAVAVIPNYPQNIKRLAEWLVKVAQADYELVPVSAIYEAPLRQRNMPTAESIIPPAPAPASAPVPTTKSSPRELLNTDKVSPPEHSEEH